MSPSQRSRRTSALAFGVGTAVIAGMFVPAVAVAAEPADVIINEAYLKGGSANAPFTNKFIELYNAGGTAQSLDGWSIQYRSATGTATPSVNTPLTGTIEPGDYFLISYLGNGSVGAPLPVTPDQIVDATFGASGTTGTIYLADTTSALSLPTGSVVAQPNVVDLLGYGASQTFEGAVAPVTGANGVPNSLARTNFVDTDNNAADFSHPATITPQASSGGSTEPTPEPTDSSSPTPTPSPTETTPGPVTVTPISEIQGTGPASPLVGQTVTTRGVVTATYPTGGYNGFYIQTPGTGGAIDLATHTASEAVFVYGGTSTTGAAVAAKVKVGDHVEVTGPVVEFNGTTELTPTIANVTVLTEAAAPVAAAEVAWPADEATRETLEGMLIAPQGAFTVSDTYDTNYYASIGLAAGDQPLITPTDIARPGTAEYDAAVADNAARAVTLDDGASINFNSTANKGIPLPYLSSTDPVRVGAPVTFTQPVIVEFRNSMWNFQPTAHLTVDNAATVQPATFANTRTDAPAEVGGDIRLASFNVLNYFTTTAAEVGCTSVYNDRAGNPITANRCPNNGPRGAATEVSLDRQEAKIVAAINALDADVVSLEEIENSAAFGKNRDTALQALVAALNADLGADEWAFVPSPSQVPSGEDVIRTAFIYKADAVSPVGDSVIDTDAAFSNARRPLAQAFAAAGSDDVELLAIVNHFKSKGDSDPPATGDNANGVQGAFNGDRVRQATALVEFADEQSTAAGTDDVYLLGDFNAYTQEDPMQVLYAAGYVDLGSRTGKHTYSFDGASGSLDHILASGSAAKAVTGVDIWNINAAEAIALEYSRYNYNATIFYDESPFRSSDHDPVVVGIELDPTVEINLLNINDFHGRIDDNTVKFAATIEQLRAEHGDDNTLLLSDGDNIGASLFASSLADDKPTLDVLNALELAASAVGNHEFDKGLADLKGRVTTDANFPYLGANVYDKGTKNPALQEYATFEVDGLTVAVIGAVTQETPTLVSPGGIATVDFGDPVEAVNRVAAQLTDGDPSNGEADVIIAEFHEGAAAGETEKSTLEEELADGKAFADIVNNTSAAVDAIFTGHTHKLYAWDAPIAGTDRTRPVLQTGNYGENIGQVVLSVNADNGDVVSYTQRNVARYAGTATNAELATQYPRVAEVKQIVDAALVVAKEKGEVPVGSVTADITTAFTGGSYVNGVYTGGTRDNRAGQSTLGNLVADSIVQTLADADRGGAEIGVVNPGGLRAELSYAPDGTITYAEANAVLPFVNNLWTTTLTGAQFKAVLEEQWQTNADGTVPSRPYLALGLSDNVSYTFDESAARGSRITGIWIDGAAIDPAAEYRVGSFNFLLQGGDNFRTFAQGTDTRDSGLVDRDAWIAYLQTNSPVAPSYDSRSAQVTGVPESIARGEELTLQVSKLAIRSLGAPAATTLTAEFEGSDATFGSIAVTDDAATVTLTVPSDADAADTLVLTADNGTAVRVPLTVTDPAPVTLNLLNINDFHGRIDDNTVKFAATIEQLRADHGDENTLFLSDGDNIGASLYASSFEKDQPTIDVLNALGLDASAVGNHEFDLGYDDLVGRVTDAADFSYLGANVYQKGTTTPALDEYATFEVQGLTVAVIGAVTQETPTLVSPGGIAGLDFGDPVEAVNRVAAQLTDGDPSNGEADVIIAEFHEGAAAGVTEDSTLEEELKDGKAFANIVNNTSAAVDVIFTGHTHKKYAWDAAIPGETGMTRPVLQTGSYGENIGQVVLTLDGTTGEVQAYSQRNVPRYAGTATNAELATQYPRVAEVKEIVDGALARAKTQGEVPVGSVTADITTAFAGGGYVDGVYTGGTRDNRAGQSTLGNLVADSLVDSLGDPDRGGAEIGIVNPGGLRADLLYGADGVITTAEANAVLPFVNNLWTTTLTGAQFKAVLEEQWQTNADGTIPSRPYLALGLSENVSYTFDAAAPQGSHITSIRVNGEPIDPAAEYRIGSFSFLLQGGDNFRTLARGTDTRDSGLVDRDAWISYLQANENLAPSFASRSVQVTGLPATAEQGQNVSFSVAGLDLTSLGSPATTSLLVSIEGSTTIIDPVSVTDGAATVSFTVPQDAAKASTIVLQAPQTGTEVRLPLAVTEPGTDPGTPGEPGEPGEPGTEEPPTTTPTPATDAELTAALQNLITVILGDLVAGGTITIHVGVEHAGEWVTVWLHSTPRQLGSWYLVNDAGNVSVTLPTDLTGAHRLVVLNEAGEVIGWQAVTIAAAAGDPVAGGPLAVTGAETQWVAGALLAASLLIGLGIVARSVRVRRRV